MENKKTEKLKVYPEIITKNKLLLKFQFCFTKIRNKYEEEHRHIDYHRISFWGRAFSASEFTKMIGGLRRTLTMSVIPMAKSFTSVSAKTTQSIWEKYNQQLIVNPLVTKGITAGIIALIADIICQIYFPSDEKIKKKPIQERIDWRRTINFTLLNTFLMSTTAHYWYGFLSTKIVGDTFGASLKRVFFDQFFFAPAIISALFAGNMMLQGEGHLIESKLKADLVDTMKANWSVWIPTQLINFRYVPPPLRVLGANVVGFFWNIYLSSVSNKPKVVNIVDPVTVIEDPKLPDKNSANPSIKK
jgi:protein Mpv17